MAGASFSFSSTCSATVAHPGRPLLLLEQLPALILRLEQPTLTDFNKPKQGRENRSAIVRAANLFWVDTAVTSIVAFDYPADSTNKFAWMSTALDEQR